MDVFTQASTPEPILPTKLPADAFARPARREPTISIQQRRAMERAQRQVAFLDEYAKHGIVGPAARAARVLRLTVMEWQRDDEVFAQAMRGAYADAIDRVESELHRRAVEGVRVPTTVAGKREEISKFSDALLILRLKALKPQVYDRQPERGPTVNVTQTNNLVVPIDRLSDDQFRLLEQVYGAAGPHIIETKPVAQVADGGE